MFLLSLYLFSLSLVLTNLFQVKYCKLSCVSQYSTIFLTNSIVAKNVSSFNVPLHNLNSIVLWFVVLSATYLLLFFFSSITLYVNTSILSSRSVIKLLQLRTCSLVLLLNTNNSSLNVSINIITLFITSSLGLLTCICRPHVPLSCDFPPFSLRYFNNSRHFSSFSFM